MTGPPTLFDRIIRILVTVAFSIAAAAMLVMMVIGSADVVGTFFFNSPVTAALEMQEVLLAMAIFLALAHAQSRQEHICVDIITERLSAPIRRVLNLVVLFASMTVFAVIAWRTWVLATASWDMRETANAIFRFPIYPGKFLVSIGAGIAALECLRQAIWHIRRGNQHTAPREHLAID